MTTRYPLVLNGTSIQELQSGDTLSGVYPDQADHAGELLTTDGTSVSWASISTANVSEDTNLYFTDARVYSNVTQLGYITASSLDGYATNIQLSDYATVSFAGSIYDVANAAVVSADLTTANVTEDTNLYFSNARVSTAISSQTLSNATFSGVVTLGTYASVGSLLETTTINASAPSATTNFDVMTQAVVYYTSNADTNFTLNIRGNSSTSLDSIMQTGQTISIVLFVTNGGTAYRPTTFQVDGNNITPKWQNGSAPSSGNASAVDIYTFTVIKTGSATFSIFASQTKFA